MSAGSNLPWSSFTGKMRELERVVRAMPDVGAPAFRLFSAITQGMNEEDGRFICRDEVMAVACGARRRQSLSSARAALAKKHLISFEPGRPGKATVYRIALSDDDLLDLIGALSDRKKEAKMLADRDQPRRIGVKKTVRKKGVEVGVGQAAIEGAASRKADANSEIGVKGTVPTASRKPDTLHPQPTPSFSAYGAELDSVGPVSIERTAPAAVPDCISQDDVRRGEEAVSSHLREACEKLGFTIGEGTSAIGDELQRMKIAVAEFPGDEVAAKRRIWRVLTRAREARDAA